MILKVNDADDFNISMKLEINYDIPYMEILVIVRNKKAHTTKMRQFHCDQLKEALQYFEQTEAFLIGG